MAPMAEDEAASGACASGPPAGFKAKKAMLEAFMRRGSTGSALGEAAADASLLDSGATENERIPSPGAQQAPKPLAAPTATVKSSACSQSDEVSPPRSEIGDNHEASLPDTSAPRSEPDRISQPRRYSNAQSTSPSAPDSSTSVTPPRIPRKDSGHTIGSSTNSPRSSLGDMSTLLSVGSVTPTQNLGAGLCSSNSVQGDKRPTAWQRRNLEEEIKALQSELAQARQRELDQAKIQQRLQQENARMAKELEAFHSRDGLLRTLNGSPSQGLAPIASFHSSLTDSERASSTHGGFRRKICRGVCGIFGRR